MSKKQWIVLAVTAWSAVAFSACPSIPTNQRFTLNGPEATDKTTGLTWSRCSVGQKWDGTTCAGSATTVSREEAGNLVKKMNGWRLPTTEELNGLLERSCVDPAIDAVAFPSTPSDWYWSDAPDVTNTNFFRHVYFYGGELKSYHFRDYFYRLRLVRARSEK